MPIRDTLARGGRSLLGAGKGFAGMVGRGLEGAAAAGAVTAAGAAATHVYSSLTKARDFKNMMASPFNSDLKALHEQSPDRFNAAFNSLRKVNAPLTQDPMVAGAYLRRVMMFDDAGATGVMVEALSQKDRMGASPMVDAIARGSQLGVQHVFSDRVNQGAEHRSVGISGKIEQERLKARHTSPYAVAEQQDKYDLQDRQLMGQALLEQHKQQLRDASAAAAREERAPKVVGIPGGVPVVGGNFIGVPENTPLHANIKLRAQPMPVRRGAPPIPPGAFLSGPNMPGFGTP